MQAVIPIMRKQGSGRIVNIASVGGRIAVPFHSGYHGTKFAVEGLSESTKYELEPFGIKVILIEPGAVGSSFWKNMKKAQRHQILIWTPHIYKWQIICQKHKSKWHKIQCIHLKLQR